MFTGKDRIAEMLKHSTQTNQIYFNNKHTLNVFKQVMKL